MKNRFFLFFLPFCCLIGCDTADQTRGTISIQWNAPTKLACSQLRVIPLQTDSSALIGAYPRYIMHRPESYFVADDDKIICFDKNGKIQSVIAARGRGPQEAYDMSHFTATDSTLLVADLGHKRMLEFDLGGTLRHAWPTERYFHHFVWFSGAILLNNQTGDHHDDCVLPVCDVEGKIIHTPQIPIVGKKLNWPPAFFLSKEGCYYFPALQNDIYLIDRNYKTLIAYSFDFGVHGLSPDICEQYAQRQNLFIAFADYLRKNDKIAFITFAKTDRWLQLGFYLGGEKPYNWFMNRETGRQYLVPITADGTSPWNHPVIGAEDDRFIVKVEAADYRRWPDCAVEGLAEDANPVLLLCAPQED